MRLPGLLVLILLAVAALLTLWWSSEAVGPTETPTGPALTDDPPGLEPPSDVVAPEADYVEPGIRHRSGVNETVADAVPEGAIGKGMARILVKVTGAPASAWETARGHRRFHLYGTVEDSSLRFPPLEFDLESPEVTAPWDVPAGVPLRIGLVALGRSGSFQGAPLTLSEGATEEIAVDLGHGAVRSVQITDVPCDAVAGLRVECRGDWGVVRLPGGRTESFEVRAWGVSDPSGRALVLAPKGKDVAYTLGLKQRAFAAELRGAEQDGTPTLSPAVPLVTLRSAPGTKLLVEGGIIGAPSDWTRDHDESEAHIVLLPSVLPEPQRVLVDGKSLGMIGPDAWPVGQSLCLDVGDLLWSAELATVTFTLLGFGSTEATLILYPGSNPGGHFSERAGPRSSLDISLESSRWQLPVGAIREPSEWGGGAKGLGKWVPETNGDKSCEIFLEPGNYVACLQLKSGYRRVLLLDPIVVGDEGGQTVLLEEPKVRRWTIVPRDAEGRRCAGLSMPGNLWVEAIKLAPDQKVHGRWPYEGGPEGGPEPCFSIETFGVQPTLARLSRTPGANGRIVPLRPVVSLDAAAEANLVAVVPVAQLVYVPIAPVAGGYLGGSVDGEVDVGDVERMFSSDIEVVPSTVAYDEEKGIGVALRSPRVTGVITEAKGANIQVRDWFTATSDGIELSSGGRGRFLNLISKHGVDLRLRLIPGVQHQAKHLPAYHGMAYANSTRRLWVPECAERLEWWNGETLVGASDELALDAITIE